MKKMMAIAALALSTLLLALSCQAKRDAGEADWTAGQTVESAEIQSAAAPQAIASPSPEQARGATERKIVRTAQLELIVDDTQDALGKVNALVQEIDGYVADSQQWKMEDQLRARLTVRVPSEQLQSFLVRARALAREVQLENVTGQDVTEEYVDLQAQVDNLRAAEKELRELMTIVRERTQKAAEVIEVHKEIVRIRGEIDRITGRMKYLDQAVALSTITIDLIPDVLAKPVAEPGWRPIAVAKDAARSLVGSLRWVADAAIWLLIYFVPLALVVLLPVLGLRAAWRARRRRAGTAGQGSAE